MLFFIQVLTTDASDFIFITMAWENKFVEELDLRKDEFGKK